MIISQHKVRPGLLTSLLVLLTLCISLSAGAGVQAQLDRNKVYEGDPVTLIIKSDGRRTDEPDLSPLEKDFIILSNSSSSQVSIVNGQRTDNASWTVVMRPRHQGKLRIPPITVGSEQTEAIDFTPAKVPDHITAQQARHLFIEAEVDKSGPIYVQQQIPYTFRFYYDDRVLKGELVAPQPENAVVERLGEDKRYRAKRNGQTYQVIERHYAISAEKSGKLEIPAVVFEGRMASSSNPNPQRSRQQRLIDRLFNNDPFFSSDPSRDSALPVRVRSKVITLDIQPRPASAGNTWLPAEQLIIDDSWIENPPQLRVGEPVTRTITLQAKGLTGVQIPVLQLEQPKQTRLYPETPSNESRTDGDKVYGISRQVFTYLPGKSGKLLIPEIALSWWNTTSNQQEIAQLPKWEFFVESSTNEPQAPVLDKPADSTGLTHTKETPTNEAPVKTAEQGKPLRLWLIAGVTTLLVAILFIVLRRIRQKKTTAVNLKQNAASHREIHRHIDKLMQEFEFACNNNDAQAAAQNLLDLGNARWPDASPRNLGSLASHLEQAKTQIMALDRALYAANASKWEGTELYASVKAAWGQKAAANRPSKQTLAPLYPLDV